MSFGKFFLKKAGAGALLAAGVWGWADRSVGLGRCSTVNKVPAEQPPADLYVWGNGVRTDRSEYLGVYPGFEPTKVVVGGAAKPMEFKKVFFSDGIEAGIDPKGDLYVWPTKSQLSMELYKENTKNAPTELNTLNPAFSTSQSTVLPDAWILDENFTTRDGLTKISSGVVKVTVMGDNLYILKTNGQVDKHPVKVITKLEQGIRKTAQPKKETTVKLSTPITDIVAGDEHLLFLTQEGQVYCLGDDTLGQCGQGVQGRPLAGPFDEKIYDKPVLVKGLEEKKIVKLAAGGTHNIAVDSEGTAWGWGNNGLLQLSHEKEFSRYTSPITVFYAPTPLNEKLGSNKVISATAGKDFTVLVTETKPEAGQNPEVEVFATGANRFGQLGLGGFSECSDFEKLVSVSNIQFQAAPDSPLEPLRVQKLECGNNHCLCLMDAGVLFEWGQNSKGQLGNKRKAHAENPLIVSTFKDRKIIDISCGADLSGVLAEPQQQTETSIA